MSPPQSEPPDFWAKVQTGHADECWPFLGYIEQTGYGRLKYQRKQWSAHRLSYILTHGEIPDGLQLDHLCRVRHCVNPNHLEPVTAKVNVHRSLGVAAINMQKENCLRGHPLSGENLVIDWHGWRQCRTCLRESVRRSNRRQYLKRKAAAQCQQQQ